MTRYRHLMACVALLYTAASCHPANDDQPVDAGTSEDAQTDAEDDSADADGSADTGDGPVDTSSFSGTLVWTEGDRGALAVRDLASNQISTILARGDEMASFAVEPDISQDGSNVVFTVDDFDGLSVLARVQKVDLVTNERIEVPRRFAESNRTRSSSSPSASSDGSLVAFSQDRASISGEFVTTSGDSEIAVWDGASEPRVIADVSEAGDEAPVISADGTKVLFLAEVANQDAPKPAHFYIAATDGETPPRKIAYDNYEQPLVATRIFDRGAWSPTDDLSMLAFVADIEATGERGAFLLDTASGSVDRLGTTTNAKAVDIAADGSAVLVVTGEHSHLSDERGWQMDIFDTSAPSEGTRIGESEDTFCASADLSQNGELVTYTQTHCPVEPAYSMHLMRADGTDNLVMAKKNGVIGLTTGETTTDFR